MRTAAAQPTRHQQVPETAEVRVLIIDDNPSFTELLSSALETVSGIACLGAASSAAEGLQRVVELRPSVVVMDIVMPDLDGLSATRLLRQLSPSTAVAVVSAYGQGEWIARAEDAGASAYIPKSGSLDELVEVLRAARPGPMIVAPSLSSIWTAWTPAAPEPGRDACHSVQRPLIRPGRLQLAGQTEPALKTRHSKRFNLRGAPRKRVAANKDTKNRC